MTYPDGIDALVNVNATDTLAAGGHAARHNSVNTALVEVKDYLVGALGSKLNIAGGKILQIVRATDSTQRSTTSTSFVDASISVTITPQKSDSAIIVIAIGSVGTNSTIDGDNRAVYQISDSSNNAISGAQLMEMGVFSLTGSSTRGTRGNLNVWAYATPGNISAVTYKLRFKSNDASVTSFLLNNDSTGQMYALEVSA